MLAHRLRRWPNIETSLCECPVFAEGGDNPFMKTGMTTRMTTGMMGVRIARTTRCQMGLTDKTATNTCPE